MRTLPTAVLLLSSSLLAFPAIAQTNSAKCPDEQAMLDSKPGISSAERQKVRTATFDALDKDKDGIVSRSEYVNCLVESPAFEKTGQGAKAVKK